MDKMDKRSREDRRNGIERRGPIDMRKIDLRIEQGERRTGKDSRSGDDRRTDES